MMTVHFTCCIYTDAAADEPLALLWVSDSQNIDMTDGVAIASSITSPDLVIRRNTLVPGSTYRFSLRVQGPAALNNL